MIAEVSIMRRTALKAASVLLRAWAATWRLRVVELEPNAAKLTISTPAVIAFWHDEMLPVWLLFSDRRAFPRAVALTSLSRDGDILARLLHDWQYDVVRGSSSKGGSEAMAAMETALKTDALRADTEPPPLVDRKSVV